MRPMFVIICYFGSSHVILACNIICFFVYSCDQVCNSNHVTYVCITIISLMYNTLKSCCTDIAETVLVI